MSVAGWVVRGDENSKERQLQRQAEGATPQRNFPGETSVGDERISEFPRVVNKRENPRPTEFSNRELFLRVSWGANLCFQLLTEYFARFLYRCCTDPEFG